MSETRARRERNVSVKGMGYIYTYVRYKRTPRILQEGKLDFLSSAVNWTSTLPTSVRHVGYKQTYNLMLLELQETGLGYPKTTG